MNVRLVPLACNRPRLGVAVLLLATVVGCAGRAAMKADGSAPQTDGEVTPDADASLGLDADWADAARLGVVAVLTGLNPPDIRLVSLDTTSALTTGGIVQIPEAALDFTRSADGRFLYVLGRKVASFAVEPANLLLTALNEVETSLSNWSGLAVDPSRRWLMLSDNTYGIVAFGLRPDGTVVRPNGATLTGQRVSEITFDPAGKILFGLSCSDDIVFRYAFDADNGTLREQTPPVPMPMAGPAQIAFHPTMKVAYVLSSKDQTATSFEYDATTGTLSAPDTIPLVAAGSQALLGYCGPGHIVVHPSGKLAYATTSEGGGSVTVMSVSTSGRLTVVGHEHYFLFRGADALAIDPSGTHLLVGNTAGGLQVFKIDPNDGLLTYVSFGVQGVHALQFLP